MENRLEKRLSINLPSHVSSKRINSSPCILKDFCLGGGLIECDDKEGILNGQMCVGDEVVLHLKIPSPASFLSFQIQAKVVRVVKTIAAGIAFKNPDPAALQALENYIAHSRMERAGRKETILNNEGVKRVYA